MCRDSVSLSFVILDTEMLKFEGGVPAAGSRSWRSGRRVCSVLFVAISRFPEFVLLDTFDIVVASISPLSPSC